jgi:competence protein ComEC
MSLERGYFFVLISTILFRLTAAPVNYFVFCLMLIFLYRRVGSYFTIIFFFLVCLSIFLQLPSESNSLCGKIVDIREKVTILSIDGDEYSIFDQEGMSLDDQVCLNGTIIPIRIGSTFVSNPIHRWSNQRNHRGSIDVENIEIIQKGNSLRNRLFERISMIDHSGWLKAYIFSHPAPQVGHFTAIFLSSGLIVTSLVSVLKGVLGYLYTEKIRQYVITMILLLCWLIIGNSFVLSRILLSDGCRYFNLKTLGRVSLAYTLLLCFYPHHLFHPALLIPCTLSLINAFDYPRFLTRMAILPLIQTLLTYRFDFVTALFFPVFRVIAVIGYLFAWLCVFFPQLTDLFAKTCEWLSFDGLHHFSYFRLVGYPGILLSALWLFLIVSKRLSKKQLIIRLCGLLLLFQLRLFLNPFTSVTFFNVAQADSALIELPYRQGTWLIDTGRAGTSSLLRANLWYRGISYLDAVVISHNDNDHSGGLEMLQKDFSIGKITTDHVNVDHLGFSLHSLLDKNEGASDNDNSLVHLFSINGFTYLFLGDISKDREADLIRKFPFLHADVIKLAHHGSKTSTSEGLLASLQPRLTIISADPRVYGHPHKQTLRTLWQFRVPYLSTHMDGDIRISTLGNFHFVMSSAGGFGIMRTVIK